MTDEERMDVILYDCDPDKNIECRKRSCYINGGECKATHDERYKVDGTVGMTARDRWYL